MDNNKAADEEGFQAELFKHGLCALVSHLVDLFNHVVCTCFPSAWSHHIIHPIHTNWAPTQIPTTTWRSWWATRSQSSMLRFSTWSSLVRLSNDTSELGVGRLQTPSSDHWSHLYSSSHHWGGTASFFNSLLLFCRFMKSVWLHHTRILVLEAQRHWHLLDLTDFHHVPIWVGPWLSPHISRDVW